MGGSRLKGDKFSVLAYMSDRNDDKHEQLYEIDLPDEQGDERFDQLTELVRGELATLKGRTEEDRFAHSELLNRAVLGFADARIKMLALIEDMIARHSWIGKPPEGSSYTSLAEALFAEVIGLSVLEMVLKDGDELEEIQVVGTQIYEVRGGAALFSAHQFRSVSELERIQQNLVLYNNDSLNPRKRWAEVMLPDGSRVTMTGFGFTAEPTLTIRFFTMKRFTIASLAEPEYATLDAAMQELLVCILRSMFNLVIIGPTNSGKTNLMKALIAEMDDGERLITIESRHELKLRKEFPRKNIIEYEIDEDDERHNGFQAFKLALRQSPKRICHAEIRDEDANIYVRACTRGHEGSMTSVHVSQLEDAPDAITDMCMMDGRGMDPHRLRKRVAEYVTQIGIEMAIVGGCRKIVRISEFSYTDGEILVQDLVRFDYMTQIWKHTGKFSRRFSERIRKWNDAGYSRMQELGFISND